MLDKLDKRLKSCTHRKPSQVLTHFEFAQAKDQDVQSIHLSESLSLFKLELKSLLAKFLAVHEFSEIDESHEEKHRRIFEGK